MSEVTWTKGALLESRIHFTPCSLYLAIHTTKAFHRQGQPQGDTGCWELGEVRLTWRKCPGIDSWCQTAAVFTWCWAWAQVGSRQVKVLKGVSQDPHPPGQGNSDRVDRQVCPGPCPHKLRLPGSHQGLCVGLFSQI